MGSNSYWTVMRDHQGTALEFSTFEEAQAGLRVVETNLTGRYRLEEAQQRSGERRTRKRSVPHGLVGHDE